MSIVKNPVVTSIVGGVIGLLAGVMIGKGSVDGPLHDAVQRAMAPMTESSAAQSSAMAALSARIESLEAQLAEGASASEDLVGTFGAQLAELKDSIGGAISGTASEQSEALKTALAEISTKIASQAEALKQAAVRPRPDKAESAAAPAPAADPVAMPAAGPTLGAGQTALFADGAVRAFVRRVTAEGAVLSINGASSEIGAGESVVVRHDGGTCRVGVAQVSGAGVALSSDCDGGAAPEDGVSATPGQTVMLADGALRAFVSGVVGGDARLSINGVGTQVLAVGESAETEVDGRTCSVTVTGIRGGTVGLTGRCD
ncbi:hypothetical protein QO034_12090 [Sedimentitalea sp. JM2-8]|uniref:Uncharacterized protein n=1 Tax=Sedimentitalea xiamensis TaxID=3050037 RepID=A0ABT7FFE6_9RHOB|nr:hypothetical protein [Sedimentitalea xiamensis]MDK3073854.1 hypothetical protein [Sedimentitalea xiamensis]